MANADSPFFSVRILVVDDFEPWRQQVPLYSKHGRSSVSSQK
jgi:hypothetical protein